MKTGKKAILVITGIIICIMSGLNIGFYLDREWSDLYIFIKHRPIPKMLFYSPLGEANASQLQGQEGYLTPEEQKEESLYIEFIEKHEGYRRSMFLPIPVYRLL